jgi:aldehyde:ferredoxin oxidoreductase
VNRRLLHINPAAGRWWLETLPVERLPKDPREDYFVLSGEALCQALLRRDPEALIIARGPLPFIAGNKATLGYRSPLTELPHYSFVGGQTAAQLLNLGLDAIVLEGAAAGGRPPWIVITGRAPDLEVRFERAEGLPGGQRAAYYHLLARWLDGEPAAGSVLTVGDAAYLGYRSANLAADGIYHAGRGGCGHVFARFASALVLRAARTVEPAEFLPDGGGEFARRPNALLMPLLQQHCARFMRPDGGTIPKLAETGRGAQPTLPALNARQLGSPAAALGSPEVLKATRQGRTGCQWCPVDCRFTHPVEADYAPDGFDRLLDDFEPTYATFAMLGLRPADDTIAAWVALRREVDRALIVPIEQAGLDVMDVGLALAALFEGLESGLIPLEDVPAPLRDARLGDLDAAVGAVELLRSAAPASLGALAAVAGGPQALAEAYPALAERVFTCGPGTLGNAGHCNALWTFLMPFSRFFGHYVGQLYKIEEPLPPPGSPEQAYRDCFERVVRRILARERFWLLGNALSQCAFTFVIYSQDGEGERLSDDGLLLRVLRQYGINATRQDLEWFAHAFWAQSVALKLEWGWRPPTAEDFPARVYEALSLALGRPVDELRMLMGWLIEEWKRQTGEELAKMGYEI